METELQLTEAIARGDRQAMRRLYDRYSAYATAVGLRYVGGSGDDVRDVLQDSFVKILTQVDRFSYRGEGSLRSWVGRVVANTAIDHLRRKSRYSFTDVVPDDVATPDDEPPDVAHVPPEVLTEMIGRLPEGYRVVLNLFVFEQLSHREIGRRLGIKEDSSASQLTRAKRRLARMIKDYLNHQPT